ncbi:MAG TPA: S41 family peptidase [Salinivirga sp.]|uniref:S41 family peptidase n=1 Tax=Salinivirga sp. TaxID=1970192 RepID=UPI002B46EFB5|nr:S41 family peptidase [Salinivirga sp.]HKK59991.1 S41 family peptidase [Salinivirga sp.]
MKQSIFRLLIVLLPFLLFYSCYTNINKQRKVKNISAFTKLYGYVRWFHPSDEAQKIDWKKFAVYGVKKVENAPNDQALRDSLLKLFRPIAPTLSIMLVGEKATQTINYKPKNHKKFDKTYWQHFGVYLGKASNSYRSIRVNRKNSLLQGKPDLLYLDKLPIIANYARVRLSFDAKSIDNFKAYFGFINFHKIQEFILNPNIINHNQYQSSEWTKIKIEDFATSNKNTFIIAFQQNGLNPVFIDNIKIEYLEDEVWKTYPIENGSFSNYLNKNKQVGSGKYDYYKSNIKRLLIKDTNKDNFCIRIKKTDSLFAETPGEYDILQKQITKGLRIKLPIVLHTNENNTYPILDSGELLKLKEAIEKVEYTHPYNWLGSYTIAWNVFQHFFPYHEELDVQWKNELIPGIMSLYNTQSNQQALKEFRRLMSKTKDGHLTIKSLYDERDYFLPIRWQWIEDQLVIISSHYQVDIPKGSIVNKIAGQPAKAYFNKIGPLVPAPTEGFHNYKMEMYTLKGAYNDSIELTIKTPQERTQSFYLRFKRKTPLFNNPNDSLPRFRSLKNGITYCNMGTLPEDIYIKHLEKLKSSSALIFDLRNYPGSAAYTIIRNLMPLEDTIKPYYMPQTIYPDRKDVNYNNTGWNLKPNEVQFKQPVVFLTNAMAISYAESIMLWVKHYGLGTIIGQPTAGTNGNINMIGLPVGKLVFTGLKVEFPDGTQHFARGVLPDIEVKQTVEAFREGRDLQLEKAVEFLSKIIIAE